MQMIFTETISQNKGCKQFLSLKMYAPFLLFGDNKSQFSSEEEFISLLSMKIYRLIKISFQFERTF